MMLPGGVVGVLDCGMVRAHRRAAPRDIENMLLAIVQQDGQEMTDIVTRVGSVPRTWTTTRCARRSAPSSPSTPASRPAS